MSLFQKPASRSLSDAFPPGVPFRLVNAEIVGLQESPTTGEQRTLAKILVSEVMSPEQEFEYGVWGSLAEQVQGVEPGELPAIVTLSNTGGIWQFVPHGTPPAINADTGEAQSQRVVPEAHMVPDAPSDPANPAPDRPLPPAPPIDPSSAETAPPVPPPQTKQHATPIDESQVFQPGAAIPPNEQGS